MKLRPTITALAILFVFTLSCKKNSDPNPGGPCTQANLTARVDDYSAAASKYATAPTPANCTALVASYDAYLSSAQNCSFVTKAQLDAIQQSRAGLASICK